MLKRVLVLTLGLLLIASLSVHGAKKPKDERLPKVYEKIKPAEENISSQYLTTPEPKIIFPATNDTIGFTYWDAQHNNSMRRQIANDYLGNLLFTWMDYWVDPTMDSFCYVYYNFLSSSGAWLAHGTGIAVTLPQYQERGGYTGLDILPDSREVLCFHLAGTPPDSTIYWGTTIAVERTDPRFGEFNLYDIPDSINDMRVKGMWPTVACSKEMNGDTAYIHITHTQFIPGTQEPATAGSDTPTGYVDMMRDPTGDPKDLGYVRCFEKPTNRDTLVCQSPGWSSPLLIRNYTKLVHNKVPYKFATARLGGTAIATSPVSKKVAVVWLQNTTSGSTLTKNELMYLESTNNGNDWMADSSMEFTVKVTNYANEGYADRAYPDIAAVYDYNNVLHLVWTTFKSTNQNDVTLWHWSASTGIRKVGSVTASSTVNPGFRNLLIAKMTMGVEYMPSDSSAYNYLYVIYTKFNDSDISASGFANGDLYLKASSNGGLSWGPEENLTNTNSNGCIAGNCKSEHWSSVAERVDSFLYVQYIYDLDAGSAVYREGSFTKNPVRYLKYPRPLVPAVPGIYYAPSQLTSPTEWATNHSSKIDSIKVDNTGTATLQVQLSGPTWLTIAPNSFSIAELGPTQKVTLTFNGGPYADTFLTGKLMVVSNSGGGGGGGAVWKDTQYVNINFVVTDSFYNAEFDTCKRGPILMVSNVSNMGGQSDSAGMFYKDLNYLFDGSPIMVTNQVPGTTDTVGFSWIHDKKDFIAEGHLDTISYPSLKTKVWIDKFALLNWRSPDTDSGHWAWFGWTKWSKIIQFDWVPGKIHAVLIKNWWTWNKPPKWWMDVTATAPVGGYFGIGGDWDVTASFSGKNKGGIIDSLNLVYLVQDTVVSNKYYGGYQFLRAYVKKGATTTNYTAPFAKHVGNNQTQMYPTGGYDDDSLWKYMSMPGDFIEQDSAQDMNVIISAVEMLNPDTTTEIGIDYTAIVSDSGLTDFVRQAAMFKKVKPGDANMDGNVTVADIVYLVNFQFKAGPEPWRMYSDANGDAIVTVADIVYLVNYQFKGGPPAKFIVGDKPF